MGVKHQLSGHADAFVTWSAYAQIHPGIGEVRVGTVSTTVLDTSKVVTFGNSMEDTNYGVFIQPLSATTVSAYPSALTPDGFTLNLSLGVNSDFFYIAVELPT